jgi:hypothetical protein
MDSLSLNIIGGVTRHILTNANIEVLNPKIALNNIIAYKQRQAGYSHGQKGLALFSISATVTSHTR